SNNTTVIALFIEIIITIQRFVKNYHLTGEKQRKGENPCSTLFGCPPSPCEQLLETCIWGLPLNPLPLKTMYTFCKYYGRWVPLIRDFLILHV
ncbi:MAG TPA: hypothetical protein PK922_00605, partial [Syntrophorhabdus sp.]|nr:hypothetical protein [Syntrophorhabdus sp.]